MIVLYKAMVRDLPLLQYKMHKPSKLLHLYLWNISVSNKIGGCAGIEKAEDCVILEVEEGRAFRFCRYAAADPPRCKARGRKPYEGKADPKMAERLFGWSSGHRDQSENP